VRITSRAKYGIAAMSYLASQYDSGRQVPLVEIADTLSVSKVYMEQIIGMLKLSGCLIAVKGPYGGY